MTGRLRAERAAWRAVRRVPAYRAYLSAQGVAVDRLVPAGILEKLPETDKHSYVDAYPLAQRCMDGRIPFVGTTIDESSGPNVKHLLDEGDADRMPWSDYRMQAMVGGEGMTEELRDHLLRRFESVYSGYGATDIEIGMAGESPASVAIRRLARARPELRRALFGDASRLPMVFQYNPLIHYLEVNAEREGICTISRPDVLSPRIRYNVHDEGGLLDYGRMMAALGSFGLDPATFGHDPLTDGPRGPLPWVHPVRLPFLWIFGRRDATISVMGANIYPEDVETVIYKDGRLAT